MFTFQKSSSGVMLTNCACAEPSTLDYASGKLYRELQTTLMSAEFPVERLRTLLRIYHYFLHEASFEKVMNDKNAATPKQTCVVAERGGGQQRRFPVNQPEAPTLDLPAHHRHCLQTFPPNYKDPLRPTELLDRVIKSYKSAREIQIPSMQSCVSSAGSKKTVFTNSSRKQPTTAPHFKYEHGGGAGKRRNLPLHANINRLLTGQDETDIEVTDAGVTGVTGAKFNSLTEVYSPFRPPLMNNKQPQKKVRRRKVVCKYCRGPPGDHENWCILFHPEEKEESVEKPALDINQSHLEIELHSNSSTENTAGSKTLPTLINSSLDLTNEDNAAMHRTIHDDVYIRALADVRARLISNKARDFICQTTKPWAFSYFSDNSVPKPPSRKGNGMVHIFGKGNTDFTEYYRTIVKENEHKRDDSINTSKGVN